MAPSWRTCASAKGMTDAEVLAAAEYFAALKPKRIIKVVESETIPKTGPSRLFYVKSPEGGTEPLGQRIVEMPDDVDQFELRELTSDVHGLCAGWKRGEGRNTRENRWIGNDHYLQHLPRAEIERRRPNSADWQFDLRKFDYERGLSDDHNRVRALQYCSRSGGLTVKFGVPQEKAEGELAVALGGNAGDLCTQQIERARRNNIGGGCVAFDHCSAGRCGAQLRDRAPDRTQFHRRIG